MHLVSCTNTHRDVTDLVNHGMVKNTKTWISWERNIIFLRNKKIVNLCFRWHILRSYRFVMEVTFKVVSFTVVAKYFWASRIKGECAEDILWPKLACTAITPNMHRIYNLIWLILNHLNYVLVALINNISFMSNIIWNYSSWN